MYIKILKLGRLGRFRAILDMFFNLIENSSLLLFGISIILILEGRYDAFYLSSMLLVSLLFINLFIDRNLIIYWSEKSVQKITNDYLEAIYKNSRWGVKNESLVDILSGDINSIRKLAVFYEEILPQFIEMFILFIALLFLTVKNNSIVFIIVPMAFLIMYFISFFVRKLQHKVNNRRDKRYLNMGAKFMEDLQAMPTILNYNAGNKFQNIFNDKSEKHRKDIIFSLGISLPRSAGRIIVANIGIVLCAYILNKFYLEKISLIELMAIIYLNTQILVTTKKFAYANKQVHMLKPVLNRVLRLIDSTNEVKNYDIKIDEDITEISLKNATFSYDRNQNIFNQVNLSISKGKLYNIVGENGAGKSTLIKLIKGQINLNSGDLILNNTNIKDIDNSLLAKQISIIEKENFLFNATIKENLEYANKNKYPFEKVVCIIDEYGLLDFINEFPMKWDTQIGENGNLLSNGQTQQLVFAMHLLQDKNVYILDEATSSINPENTKIILDALKKISADKIVINITHNKNDISYSDENIFVNKGELIQGTHKQLLKNDDYIKLYEKLGNEDEENI
ncbi:ATP-binding cassette domain-containing protein [Helcococcus kunzii]